MSNVVVSYFGKCVKVGLGDCSFVDIGGIVDRHRLNLLFIIILCNNNDR